MNAEFRDLLTTVGGELLQTGHWSPAEDYLSKLSELLSLEGMKAKDFIAFIDRVCPGVIQFRVVKDHATLQHKYLVRSLLVTRKKFRGYPLRSPIEVKESFKQSRRAPVIFQELPAHVGAMGNWQPLQISNISAALRAGRGCVAGTSDFVLEERQQAVIDQKTHEGQEVE